MSAKPDGLSRADWWCMPRSFRRAWDPLAKRAVYPQGRRLPRRVVEAYEREAARLVNQLHVTDIP